MDVTGRAPFTRDRLTILTYTMAGILGYGFGALGPAMPLLRDDLGISRTVGGLHFTLEAASAVAFGFFIDRLVRHWGRRAVFWTGGAGAALGALVIGLGGHPAITLAGAALIGGPGSAMLASAQSALSDRHRGYRAVALTEGNTAVSAGTVIPALVIGGLVAIGAGWRLAFAVPAVLYLATAVARADQAFPPAAAPPRDQPTRRLPRPYWLFWAAMFPAVGAEWSVAAWGAGYLVEIGGTSEASAALLMTLFFGAMVGGRYLASRLAHRFEPLRILVASAAIGLAGFMVFWRVEGTPAIVTGLFVTGLGISTLFPMLLSMAVGTAADRPDLATARISISAGSSVIVAPLALGWLADQTGIRDAFGVVPALFLMVAVVAFMGRRAERS